MINLLIKESLIQASKLLFEIIHNFYCVDVTFSNSKFATIPFPLDLLKIRFFVNDPNNIFCK